MEDILAEYALSDAVDGDCIPVATAVTAALRRNGFDAETVCIRAIFRRPLRAIFYPDAMNSATDEESQMSIETIAFMHNVTSCNGLMLDGTARQFSRQLPAAIVATVDEYRELLLAAIDIDDISVFVPGVTAALTAKPGDSANDTGQAHQSHTPATEPEMPRPSSELAQE
ncbi:hypothetical protein ACIGO9_30595 [Nocardia asteroides]|uniref:hypothetical protein n=1 Tax=Nocardia asteroides TaxID=1824 RepID=UPI0037C566D8